MNAVADNMIDTTVRPTIAIGRRYALALVLVLSALDGIDVLERFFLAGTDAPAEVARTVPQSGGDGFLQLASHSRSGPATKTIAFVQEVPGDTCPVEVRETLGEGRTCSTYVDWAARRLHVAVNPVSGPHGHDTGLLFSFDLPEGDEQGLQEVARVAVPWLPGPADSTTDTMAGAARFELIAGQAGKTMILVSRRQAAEPEDGHLVRDIAYLIHSGADGSLTIAATGIMMPGSGAETDHVPDLARADLQAMTALSP